MPCRAEWFIGDLTTVERLHTAAGRIVEGNHLSGATLVRHGGDFPPHRDAGIFQPRRQFGLVINMQTARMLGLTVPPSLIVTADEVMPMFHVPHPAKLPAS